MAEEIKEGEEELKPKIAKDKQIAELVENTNMLVQMVQGLQKRDEETRALLEAERAERMKLEDVIEQTGDKSRVSQWQRKDAKNKPREYKICTWNTKVITGWDKMKKNLVYKNELKATVEQLVTTLHYADGTSEDVQYVNWQAERRMVPAVYMGEQIKPNPDNPDKPFKFIKLRVLPSEEATIAGLAEGTEFDIEVTFLN